MKKWMIVLALMMLCFSTASAQDDRAAMLAERTQLLRAMRPYSSRIQALAEQAMAEALLAETPLLPVSSPSPAPTALPRTSNPEPFTSPAPLDWAAWEAFAAPLGDLMPDGAVASPSPTASLTLAAAYRRVQVLDEALYALDAQERALPEKIIYLTLDDGPGRKTHALLEILAQYDVRATFFLVGDCVRGRPKLAADIAAEGHVIANHSHTHQRQSLKGNFAQELRFMENSVAMALGESVPVRILRVPYGNSTVGGEGLAVATAMGYLWIDWNATNSDAIGETVNDRLMVSSAVMPIDKFDKVVLLIHENKEQTVRTLPEIIERYLAAGYVFMPLTHNVEDIYNVPMGTGR